MLDSSGQPVRSSGGGGGGALPLAELFGAVVLVSLAVFARRSRES
jgi:hypothetical protein